MSCPRPELERHQPTDRDPHIRPDYTRLEGPHQAAVVLTVIGEGLPTSKLLQKKVAVGLHVLEDRRCVTRLQSACHDKPHAPGGLDRTFERHSASTDRQCCRHHKDTP